MTPTIIDAGILGTGMYVPERVLTNFDLERMVDTSDEWIVARTGIRERHIAPDETPTSELALKASLRALGNAHVDPNELDLIIFATLTPDCCCPSAAATLQHKLNASRAAAFDLEAACSGFVYALATACQFVHTGVYRYVLVIGAETLSKYVNWEDRNTCVLFGDGAGAAVVGPVDPGYGLLAFDLGSDGSGADLLGIPASGTRHMITEEIIAAKMNRIHMNGKEVFKFATRAMPATLRRSLTRANVTAEQLAWLVPHQANLRIIQAAARRLALPLDKVIVNIDKYGNVSAASIPMALAEADAGHRLRKGDIVALAGFGAGLTWASCVMRWAKGDL